MAIPFLSDAKFSRLHKLKFHTTGEITTTGGSGTNFDISAIGSNTDLRFLADNDDGASSVYFLLDASMADYANPDFYTRFPDNSHLVFGNTVNTANLDFEIYHDSAAYLQGVSSIYITSENLIQLNADSGIDLYHNNSKKFETTTSGVDVTGTINLDNLTINGAQGSDGQVLTSTGSGIAWEDASGGASLSGGAANKLAIWTSATALTNDTNLHWDTSNDRLAIGTASPLRDLHLKKSNSGGQVRAEVFNTSNTANSHGVLSIYSGGTSGGDPFLHWKIDGTQDWSMGIDNSDLDKLKISKNFGPGTDDYLTVETSGDVGIGTSSPAQKLHVNGNVTADRYYGNGSTTYFLDPNDSQSAYLSGKVRIRQSSSYKSAALEVTTETGNGTGEDGVFIKNYWAGGSPVAQNKHPYLSLGTAPYSGAISTIYMGAHAEPTGQQTKIVYNHSTLDLATYVKGNSGGYVEHVRYGDSSSNTARTKFSGNVGIGTNPSYPLHVVGTAQATTGFTTDGSNKFYTWRALENTASSSNQYYRIARITSSQSSRFIIELAGRSTSYSDQRLPAFGKIVGQLNNDNNYDIVYYNASATDEVVDEVGQVDVSTTATDIYVRVGQFSELTATAHISDGSITTYGGDNASTSSPTNYVQATEYKLWNQGNDGASSGLDADLLDGQHGSHYLNYNNLTNTPTIPTVNNGSLSLTTGTGLDGTESFTANQSGTSTFNVSLDLSELTDMTGAVDTAVDEIILLDNGAERRKRFAEIFGSNAYNSTTIPTNNNQLTNGAGYVTSSHNHAASAITSGTFSTARIPDLDASKITSGTFSDLFSNSIRYNIGLIDGNSSQTRDKIRVWTSSSYTIGMKSGFTYGHLNDYAMSFQMNDDNDRGWWWGDTTHTDAQGAMSLTTNGRLTVAESISVGQGASVTSPSTVPLFVDGTAVFDTTSGAEPVCISRSGSNTQEVLKIGVSDTVAQFNYIEDTSSEGTGNFGRYDFILSGNSSETSVTPLKLEKTKTTSNAGAFTFGTPGNGSNTLGRWLSFEGNTDSSGEGSGRLFFSEHNSSTTDMDDYGMSIGYRGGSTSVTTAGGNSWTGLSAIGNGEWGMWGHNNSLAGTIIMSGPRNGNHVRIHQSGGIRSQIYYDYDNTSFYFQPESTSGTSWRLQTPTGYVKIGSRNSSYAHFYTDRGQYYFDKGLTVDTGAIRSYNEDLNLNRAGSTTARIRVTSGVTYSDQYLQASGSLRAPVFYDSNNTAYFAHLDSTADSIRAAGDIVAFYSSDKRYKENIKPIESPIEKVKAINGVTFEWNEKSHKETGKKDVGVIAQEVEEVLPEIVQTRDNGYKAVDYQKLTAVLIEAVKEQQNQIDELKSIINGSS